MLADVGVPDPDVPAGAADSSARDSFVASTGLVATAGLVVFVAVADDVDYCTAVAVAAVESCALTVERDQSLLIGPLR